MANKAFKILPKNYLAEWGELESWSMGAGSAPDGWIIASSPTVAQTSTNQFGEYAVSISGAGGLYRTIPQGELKRGRTFTFGCYGQSASTAPYIKLSDGVASVTAHLDGLNVFGLVETPSMKLDYNSTEIRVDFYCPSGVQAFFDSGVLCEGEDLFTDLSDGDRALDSFEPSLNMKQDQFEISQNEGSYIPQTHLSSRNIRTNGTVAGSDIIDTRNQFDTLMKSIVGWQADEKRNLYLYDDRVSEIFLKSFSWQYVRTLGYIQFAMGLSNPDSVTRSINRYRHREVIAGTVSEFNFAYNGSAESKPKISFIANQAVTISTCLLQNLTTGESISYTGTIPNGVALDIDCQQGTVFNSSVQDLANFGTSDFLKLVRGNNYFRFSGQNCQINIDYYERYM